MSKRKNVNDWRKAWRNSIAKTQKIEEEITQRLIDLCIQHPDVPIGSKADAGQTIIKAKSIGSPIYIRGLDTSGKLLYIEIIEKYLVEQHPHQQGELFN